MTDPDRAIRDAVSGLADETLERLFVAWKLYHDPRRRRLVLLRALFQAFPIVPLDWPDTRGSDLPPAA